ncbi:MAG: hypothetical protein C4K58_07675 [Flavobacteriaceae bacterium]|nr:MAG: hypothetical protein C4K58_07675 [Flavobacteriaceae bacterium]
MFLPNIQSVSCLFLYFFLLGTSLYAQNPSQTKPSDSINVDNSAVKSRKPNGLEGIVVYNSDYQTHRYSDKSTILEGNATVEYTNITLTADYIRIDWQTNEVFASAKLDEFGNIVNPTIFKEGDQEFEYESFSFNFKTKKGIASNVRTTLEEGAVVVSDKVKKITDSISYLGKSIYTTDKYYVAKQDSLPDYHLQLSKAKLTKDKDIVSGPVQLYIENVPTPLVLPFFYFPYAKTQSAGLIFPKFGERQSVGFYLENIGYYQPIGDYADVKLTADIYSKGSYGVNLEGRYIERYKFSGNLNFDYNSLNFGTVGLEDFTTTKQFRFTWNHNQDPKANPYLVLNANVNYSTSSYFRNSLESANFLNRNNLTNTISSSVSLRKSFPELPISMSLNLNHSQRNGTSSEDATVDFTLPQFNLTLQRQYPFAPKVGPKSGLLENLSVGYVLDIRNQVTTTDKEAFSAQMFRDFRTGALHTVNLDTKENILKYFSLNLNANYQEKMTLSTVSKSLSEVVQETEDGTNQTSSVVESQTIDGFDTFREFGFSASMGTTLYGMLNFSPNSKIRAIRHLVKPNLSYNYRPDFSRDSWGYFDTYVDANGNLVRYSRFDGSIFGGPSSSENQSLGISISNNIELKIKKDQKLFGDPLAWIGLKDDSKVKESALEKENSSKDLSLNESPAEAEKIQTDLYRNIKIIDQLNFNTNYNFAADSFKWSDFSFSATNGFFDNLILARASAVVDPYKRELNTSGTGFTKIDEFGNFALSSYNLNLSANFNNNTFKKDKNTPSGERGMLRFEDYQFDQNGYSYAVMPWNLSVSLNHNYSKGLSLDSNERTSFNFDGSIKPTPYWTVGGSIVYDAQSKEFLVPSLNFTRDLRSFQINFSWIPSGTNATWTFHIFIKNPMLKDLQYKERNF